MKLVAGLRKHGFRKWYERELLRSHGHLALTFICLIGVVAAFESMTDGHGWVDRFDDALVVLLCGATGLWALRRYLYLLMNAEAVAHQADCPACGTYARFKLVKADAAGERALVGCRKCGHEWTISSGLPTDAG